MTNPNRAYLEVHVFGGERQGECILLKLPDGSFGAVDSCVETGHAGERENPVEVFLSNRGVKSLSFLCLTHPHHDHYLGMYSLFQRFHPRQFWHPASVSAKFLSGIVMRSKIPALEATVFADIDKADELQLLYAAVAKRLRESRKKKNDLFQVVPVTMDLCKVEGHATIKAVAPHGNDAALFEQQLENAFDEKQCLKFNLPKENFNQISIAILVISQRFRILLGGDVENRSWEFIRRDCVEKDWQSRLYKVSHHGSSGAFSEKLRDAVMLNNRGTESVVTGFSPSRLPRTEMLSLLKETSNSVAITHSSHLRPNTVAAQNESRRAMAAAFSVPVVEASESRTALLKEFGTRKASASSSVGRCSYYFSREGKLIESEIATPACRVD